MVRTKWIVGLRNKCANLAMECDSCAAIESTRMTPSERAELKKRLREVIDYVDDKLGFNR